MSDSDAMRRSYHAAKAVQSKRESVPVDQLRALGYSDEEIEAMRGDLK